MQKCMKNSKPCSHSSVSTQMVTLLRVSWPEHLFDPLQQLLSSSTNDDRSRSHRRLLWSMQATTWKRLTTASYGSWSTSFSCQSMNAEVWTGKIAKNHSAKVQHSFFGIHTSAANLWMGIANDYIGFYAPGTFLGWDDSSALINLIIWLKSQTLCI